MASPRPLGHKKSPRDLLADPVRDAAAVAAVAPAESTLARLSQQELLMQQQLVAQQQGRLNRLHELLEKQRAEGDRVRARLADVLNETSQQEAMLAHLRDSQQAAVCDVCHPSCTLALLYC